jgi:acetyl-CoA carboxylase carboxyl transferase subunit alpha
MLAPAAGIPEEEDMSETSTGQSKGPALGPNGYLEFERPIARIEQQIAELTASQTTTGRDCSKEIHELREAVISLTKKTYANLTPWETVLVARHPKRPHSTDYINMIVRDFVELHGDRTFRDDRAMVTGFGRIGSHKVLVVGHRKGRETKEKIDCCFGCAHPEGYRKAMLKMRLAAKFNLPIVCLIDTPGAYPGIGAEERGQAYAIAYNLMEMPKLPVPIVCVVIGEGGSGGALGIGVGDRIAMLENAYYSVISPEGGAAILWKSGTYAEQAAAALKMTAKDLTALGIVDEVVPEPLGGAHRNPAEAAANLQRFINKSLKDLKRLKPETLLQRRYAKLRSMGSFFIEAPAEQSAPVAVEEAVAPLVEPVVQAEAEEKSTRKPAGRLAKAQIPA